MTVDADSADSSLLGAAAAADVGEQVAATAAAQAAPVPGKGKEWRDGAVFYGKVIKATLAEKYAVHWTDERLQAVGAELANCAEHYGWTAAGIVNHPLAKLAAVSFPLVWPMLEPYVKPALERLKTKPADAAPPPDATPPSGEARAG